MLKSERNRTRSRAPYGSTAVQRLFHYGWDEVERVPGLTECWEYRGSRTSGGYGTIWESGQMHPAHRVAYQYHEGEGAIGEGQILRHRCDNPPCIRPTHLIPGTQADNARDRDGRLRSGVAKLTPSRVREIKIRLREGEVQAKLAREFGVSDTAIYEIKCGRKWGWVE